MSEKHTIFQLKFLTVELLFQIERECRKGKDLTFSKNPYFKNACSKYLFSITFVDPEKM
ncbi:hypothetical protein [Bacillus cereus group sp. BfR-BA-01492]|uniref:hypothetical protein n=1 Tax=Bacillus cereus group sp. BfR-BA-01492 TaxID=2920361 RepID=UPI001F5779D0|nr:hypothetical protein [Bacillus cereus group sp. BfR-BA-01492]